MIETPVFVLEPIAQKWIWQGEAACRGMDSAMFFHPPGERGQTRNGRIAAAKQICQQCPVIADCLEHALRVREPYGVWGGRSEEERALLLGVESLKYPKPGSRAHPTPPRPPHPHPYPLDVRFRGLNP